MARRSLFLPCSQDPQWRNTRSRILLLGVSYKAGVGDIRESPALKIAKRLHELGGVVSYHDPYVPEVPGRREAIDQPHRGVVLDA